MVVFNINSQDFKQLRSSNSEMLAFVLNRTKMLDVVRRVTKSNVVYSLQSYRNVLGEVHVVFKSTTGYAPIIETGLRPHLLIGLGYVPFKDKIVGSIPRGVIEETDACVVYNTENTAQTTRLLAVTSAF